MVQAAAQVLPPSLANFRVQVAESNTEASRTASCADVKHSTEVQRCRASTQAVIRTVLGCDTLSLCKASHGEQAITQDTHENVVGMRSARSSVTCAGLSNALTHLGLKHRINNGLLAYAASVAAPGSRSSRDRM